MIQLTTQPLPGLVPAPRAAGFPLGTTSDFALALAELAGGAAGVVATPGAAVAPFASIAAVTPKRQAVAEGGTMLPVAADTVIVLDCIATDIPTLVPVEGVFLQTNPIDPPIGQPATPALPLDDEIVLAEDKDADDDTPSVVVPASEERERATVVALPIIADIRPVTVMPVPVTLGEVAFRAAVPPSVTMTAQPPVTPSTQRSAAPVRAVDIGTTRLAVNAQPPAGVDPAPEGVPVETTARAPVAADPVPTARAPFATNPVLTDAPIAPTVAAAPAVMSPATTVSDTTSVPVPATEAPQQSAAAPPLEATPTPDVANRPAPEPAATRRTVPKAGLDPVAVPTRTLRAEPVPVSTIATRSIDAPIVAQPILAASVPNLATSKTPPPDARPLAVSTSGTGVTPALTRRLDQAFAPGARTVAPARAASLPPTPVLTERLTSPATPVRAEPLTMPAMPQPTPIVDGPAPAPVPAAATQSPVLVGVPAERTAPPPTIAVTSPIAAPTQQPAPRPLDPASVTVTVVPLAATPPPAPQLQPAAQAFAAAMFAASAPIDLRQDASDDDLLPLSLTTAVQTAPQSATIAVAAPTQGQAPALDLAKDDWMATMIDRIETLRDDSGGIRETRMKLLPEALGNVEVSVRRDETGAIQVRIAADTAQARALLADAAPKLAEMAEARGVKLGGSSVDAGAGDTRRDAPAAAPAPVARRPAAARDTTTTDASNDTRLA